MNKVILHGNICSDIELKYIPSGKSVANFSIATNETYNGENKAEFHRCIAWEKTAETINKFMKKGSEILVEGKLQTRSWEDKDGNKKYVTEIIIRSFDFCGRKENKSNDKQEINAGDENSQFQDNLPF